MSEVTDTVTIDERRDRGGRFVIGGKPGPGRPLGARSKLGEAFLEDLRDAWNEHGVGALQRCAAEDPAAFCKIVAGLLPRDVDINLTATMDTTSFAERFRTAVELLGNEPPQPRCAPSSIRRPAVPVSQHEVDELRRKGQARSLDDADCTLQTSAELLGFVIHSARSIGADQAETLDMVELLVRSTDMWREEIREARDVLARLGYGRDLAVLLTSLARKAKPRPTPARRGPPERRAIR